MNTIVPIRDIIRVLNSNPKYDYGYFLGQGRPDLANLLISRMLTGKGRDFVIKVVKAPLEKALIRSVRLFIRFFGPVTKQNTVKHNTHVLLDLKEEFFESYINRSKMPLMQSAWELLLFENEHDSHYEWLLNWLVKRIAEERAKGNWKDLPEKFPEENCWRVIKEK